MSKSKMHLVDTSFIEIQELFAPIIDDILQHEHIQEDLDLKTTSCYAAANFPQQPGRIPRDTRKKAIAIIEIHLSWSRTS